MSDEDTQERPQLDRVTEFEGGFSWIAYPEEKPRRASHALSTDTGVWVVDPVDAEGLDDHLADLGTVAGVVVIQDRHTRDAAAVANRHDVDVHMPEWMTLGQGKLDGDAQLFTDGLPETNYGLHKLFDRDDWEEAILVDEETNTMVVPEAVGTSPGFTPDGQALAVHPVLEESPTKLGDWHPERILVGHGKSIYEGADEHLQAALAEE
jgi:hypothetical protein